LGKNYYIDIDKVIEKCRPIYTTKILDEKEDEGERSLELNVFKFECYKSCIERVLNDYEEVDDSLGAFADRTTNMSFRIAFNTLLKNEILIEDENE
jgi:hypothetical protein